MKVSFSDSLKFLLPSVVLNPVLLLHGINAILTYLLPCLDGHDENSYVQPHVNLHKNESLSWVYSALIILAQLLAFLRLRGAESAERSEQQKAGHAGDDDMGFG